MVLKVQEKKYLVLVKSQASWNLIRHLNVAVSCFKRRLWRTQTYNYSSIWYNFKDTWRDWIGYRYCEASAAFVGTSNIAILSESVELKTRMSLIRNVCKSLDILTAYYGLFCVWTYSTYNNLKNSSHNSWVGCLMGVVLRGSSHNWRETITQKKTFCLVRKENMLFQQNAATCHAT